MPTIKTHFEDISLDELKKLVANSTNILEVLRALGYSRGDTGNINMFKRKMAEYDIDYSHFTNLNFKRGCKLSEEEIFSDDNYINSVTVRDHFLKGNYSPYKCSICGLEPEWQGKPLTLIMDHIDGVNYHNNLSNLRWVCPNCNQQLPTTCRGSKAYDQNRTSKPIYQLYCKECGKIITKTNKTGLCIECNNKALGKKPCPERQILKDLIRTLPFTEIGQMYGVSDNAIRSWCEKNNLPRTKKEINKYSDEEWSLI